MALSLTCPIPHTAVFADVGTVQDTRAGRQQEYFFSNSSSFVFRQARIGAEFGATPWSHVAFRAPKTATPVMTFDLQPLFAEIVPARGNAGWIVSRRWNHEQVWMTGGRSGRTTEVRPGRIISRYGYGFTVYLEPLTREAAGARTGPVPGHLPTVPIEGTDGMHA